MYTDQIGRFAGTIVLLVIGMCPVASADDAAPNAVIANPDGRTTVPMTVQHGHLYVTASVNGKPAKFLIDSGAGANVLSPEAAQRLGVSADETAQSVTAYGAGGNEPAQGAVIGQLQVGDAFLDTSSVYIVKLPDSIPCDGLLGYDFLKCFVTTFNWTNNTLTLRNSSAAVTASPNGATILPITLVGSVPTIQANLDGHNGAFGLDTGYDGALVINTPFVEKNRLKKQYPTRLETVTGLGVGGLMHGEIVRVKAMKFGEIVVKGIVTTLSGQHEGSFADPHSAGSLGTDVLSRFTITLDYAKRSVTLEKNATFGAPFIFNRSGLGILDNPKSYQIMSVMPHSPGADAGILVGDQLLAVNDTPMDKLPSDMLWTILHGAPGTKVRLRLQPSANGPVREVTITLRDIL